MDDSTKQSALSAFRTLLAFGSGYAVAHGYLNAEQATELVGAAVVLVPLGWGWWQKQQAEKKTAAREVAAVNAGIAAGKTGEVGPTARPADVPEIIEKFAPPPPKDPP